MRCEVVAVGTELLLGQIVDTNSSWIGEQLALAGIDSFFQTKVGDNHARLVATLRHALDRSDAKPLHAQRMAKRAKSAAQAAPWLATPRFGSTQNG